MFSFGKNAKKWFPDPPWFLVTFSTLWILEGSIQRKIKWTAAHRGDPRALISDDFPVISPISQISTNLPVVSMPRWLSIQVTLEIATKTKIWGFLLLGNIFASNSVQRLILDHENRSNPTSDQILNFGNKVIKLRFIWMSGFSWSNMPSLSACSTASMSMCFYDSIVWLGEWGRYRDTVPNHAEMFREIFFAFCSNFPKSPTDCTLFASTNIFRAGEHCWMNIQLICRINQVKGYYVSNDFYMCFHSARPFESRRLHLLKTPHFP